MISNQERNFADAKMIEDAMDVDVSKYRGVVLKSLTERMAVERQDVRPDHDIENWTEIFNNETRQSYWLPKWLADAWQNVRFQSVSFDDLVAYHVAAQTRRAVIE